jgi:hypothetical protein
MNNLFFNDTPTSDWCFQGIKACIKQNLTSFLRTYKEVTLSESLENKY